MILSPYTIKSPSFWLVKEKPKEGYERKSPQKDLLFHILKEDYFGTLATALGLVEESSRLGVITEELRKWQVSCLKRSRKDLLYLQKNYKIVLKNRKNVENR